MNDISHRRFAFLPGLVIVEGEDRSWLYRHYALLEIPHIATARLIARLLELMDGQLTVAKIELELSDYESPSVRGTIHTLLESSLIRDIDDETHASPEDIDLIARGERDRDILSAARIAVFKVDCAGNEVVRNLEELNPKLLRRIEWKTDSNTWERVPAPTSHAAQVEETVTVDRCRVAENSSAEIGHALTDVQIVIAVFDRPRLKALRRINEACLRVGVPLLTGYLCGPQALIGPLWSRPGDACFACLESRLIGAASDSLRERRVRETIAESDMQPFDKLPARSAYVENMASWIVQETVDYLHLPQSTRLRNQALFWNIAAVGDGELHPLIKHPFCSECDCRGKSQRLSAVSDPHPMHVNVGTSPSLLRRLRQCHDSMTGLLLQIKTTDRTESANGEPFVLFESLAVAGAIDPNCGRKSTGSSNANNWDDAELIAGVEALERYCLLSPPEKQTDLFASYEEIRQIALFPPDLVLYSQRQYELPHFPFRPFCPRERICWVKGWNLGTRRSILLPNEFVSLSGNRRFARDTSSGAAAHTDYASAVLNGLYELVERDAFMIAWLNRLPLPRVTPAVDGTGWTSKVAMMLEKHGYDLQLYDMTSEIGIPTYLTLAVSGAGGMPALLSGAGTDLDTNTALKKGCHEVIRMLHREQRLAPRPIFGLTDESVQKPMEHVQLYADPQRLARLEFLIATPRTNEACRCRPPASTHPADALQWCVSRLAQLGMETIVVDITTPDVADLGLCVVRVFVPGLQPLHFGERYRRLGGKRLFQAPKIWGYSQDETSEQSLNPYAHFFP